MNFSCLYPDRDCSLIPRLNIWTFADFSEHKGSI
jgi:hypothetical protein